MTKHPNPVLTEGEREENRENRSRDEQVRYHEIMGKLCEWMGEDEADAEARRRLQQERERT